MFPPKEHIKLSQILNGWVDAASTYGFLQYKTSVLESADLYTDKTSEEIMREQTYRFTDRGGRDVLLRPEITPGVSSMVVKMQKNRLFRSPLKVFSIGSVFRYENTQKGRSREHIQFNADIFGDDSAWTDTEIITVAFAALEKIGFQKKDFVIYLNDRSSVEQILAELGIPDESLREVLRLLDKRDKVSEKEFAEQLSLYNITATALDDALEEAPQRVRSVMTLLPQDITAEYNPKIVRGFDYYTGMVFEIYTKNQKIAQRSVAGGGRYDTLIESYGGSPLPAIGFGMGDVVLLDCLEAFSVAQTIVENSAITYVTDEQMIAKGIQTSNDLRQYLPVSFIGTVNEKKISDMYKYYEQMKVQYSIGIEGGLFSVRKLSERHTETFTTAEEAAAAITNGIKKKTI